MEHLKDCLPFWSGLTQEQQRRLERGSRMRNFPAGSVLHQGTRDCEGLILVVEGRLRVYTISAEGRALTLYRLWERDLCLFSASCVFHSIQFDVWITAERETRVINIPSGLYKKLMEESTAVAVYTNELMASRFTEVMWLMDQLLNQKLDSRLAAFLLEESALEQSAELFLTHDRIAAHLGSAREVVTRLLRYFQQEGLVSLSRGKISLLDRKKLEGLAAPSLR